MPHRLSVADLLNRQFGNVLVLAATFKSKSPALSSLIPASTLEHLFDRTIRFLSELECLSESLKLDKEILVNLKNSCFDPSASTLSFSSMDS